MNHPNRSSFDCLGIFKNYFQKQFDLCHYNDNAVGKPFRGEKISETNVEKAREALKIYNTEMDEFQSKILATKRVSAEAYDKMMEDLDNLKRNKKSTKCNPSRASNYNLEQAQSDINDIKETMKKLAETQDKILKSLSSTLHSRK